MKRAWLIALGIVVVFGCGGSGGSVNDEESRDPVARFINASPNSTAINIRVDDRALGNNVPYLGSNANFESFEPGSFDVSIEEAADPETQAIEVVNFGLDANLLFVAFGLVTPPNDDLDKRMRLSVTGFNRTRPNGDKARLIVVHGYQRSAGNQTPNIDFRNPGDNPRINVTNMESGSSREILVDSGANTFEIRRTGSEFVIIPAANVTLEGGRIYAAIVGGLEGETGNRAPRITYIPLQTK